MRHKQNSFSARIQSRTIKVKLVSQAYRATLLLLPLLEVMIKRSKRVTSEVGIAIDIVVRIKIRRRSKAKLLADDDIMRRRIEASEIGHLPFVIFGVEQLACADHRSDRLASRPRFKHRPAGGAQRQIGYERWIEKSRT